MSGSPAPRSLPHWAGAAGVAIALIGLFVLSFTERWTMLASSPFPVGVDGYFYPVELRSLLERGELQYPAAPLTFWLMAPFAAATDPITGAKLGAALLGALIAFPAYAVGARLGRSRGAGLVAAVLATTSAGSAFLTIEFVKNGVGMTVLLVALWLVLRALETPTRLRIGIALAGAVLPLLAHKMSAVLFVAVAIPAVIGEAAGRGKLRGRRLLYVIVVLAIGSVLFGVLGLAFPLPSPTDAGLVDGLWAGELRFTAPALVTRHATLTFGHEALIGGLLGIAGAFVLSRAGRAAIRSGIARVPAAYVVEQPPRGTSGETVASWAIVVLAIAIAVPWLAVDDAQGLGFRLRIVAFVAMALAAAIVGGRVLARIHHRDLVLAVLAGVLATRTPGARDEGRIVAHPAMVTAIHSLAGAVPAGDTIVIPERHIVFMVAWYTQARVSIRPDGIPPERRWRLLPLAWIGMGSPLDDALLAARTEPGVRPPLGLHPRHPNGLVLVAEPTWQWVLDQLPPELRTRWARWRTI
ncbi:MAG: glycosyltransferase family 39 protein [Deltaproteobacteria bacterium]|nr:glycosyltransferase family 39 protein [Deltaproteobacteria bacterium]